jgi:uncharacterized protein YukE
MALSTDIITLKNLLKQYPSKRLVSSPHSTSRGGVKFELLHEFALSAITWLDDLRERKALSSIPEPERSQLERLVRECASEIKKRANNESQVDGIFVALSTFIALTRQIQTHSLSKELACAQHIVTQLKALKEEAEELKSYIKNEKSTLEELAHQVTELQSTCDLSKREVVSTLSSARRTANTINQHSIRAASAASSAETSRKETEEARGAVRTIRASLEDHWNGIEAKEERLRGVVETASQDMQSIRDKHALFLSELEESRKKADNVLAGATAGGLFKSFHKRQDELTSRVNHARIFVLISLVLVLAAALTIALWVHSDGGAFTTALYIKLSIAAPFIYLLVFAATQYNKERLLEEQYAFKANISVSLEAYRKLLDEIAADAGPAPRAAVAEWVIDAVRQIFAEPRELVVVKRSRKDVERELASLVDSLGKLTIERKADASVPIGTTVMQAKDTVTALATGQVTTNTTG